MPPRCGCRPTRTKSPPRFCASFLGAFTVAARRITYALYNALPLRYLSAMQIDVISDTVCPWCFIGKRRLTRALAMRPHITFGVKWRPYRLDPTIPKGGADRKAYMRAKFGEDPMKIVEMHKLIAA